MAAFTKLNILTEDVARGKHQFHTGAHVFKVALTNTAPVVTNTELANITEIAAGFGYTAGGSVSATDVARTGGVTDVTAADVTFTAAGGSIGPFRYAVFYNDTTTGKPLIGFSDRGSALTLAAGESLKVEIDTGVLFDIT